MEEEHTLTFTKFSERILRDAVIEKHMSRIVGSLNTAHLDRQGWHVEENRIGKGNPVDGKGNVMTYDEPPAFSQLPAGDDVESATIKYKYEMYVKVTFSRRDKAPDPKVFPNICRHAVSRSAQPPIFWTLSDVDGASFGGAGEEGDEEVRVRKDEYLGYADLEMPENFHKHFTHLYGLDSNVHRVYKAIVAGAMSNWVKRFSCALIGPPGCGKTDICSTVKDIFGEDAVLEWDGTATTSAGAIKQLSELDTLPRVIIIEEIEKSNEAAMSFLLSVLDMRSEIRKTTARSTVQRDTKLMAIATVNNKELFYKAQAGALASRFPNKIFFHRPSREQLEMILHREVTSLPEGEGNFAWIKPALDYCDKHGITDPRAVTSICLCGGDDLITGDYQRMMDETSEYRADSDRDEDGIVEEDPF